jgi:hypothetical protein
MGSKARTAIEKHRQSSVARITGRLPDAELAFEGASNVEAFNVEAPDEVLPATRRQAQTYFFDRPFSRRQAFAPETKLCQGQRVIVVREGKYKGVIALITAVHSDGVNEFARLDTIHGNVPIEWLRVVDKRRCNL